MDDLISRQAAIDAIKGLPTWWADGGGYYGGAQPPMEALLEPNDVISAIDNLPSAQQWIPCSERLPEKFGDYLVSVKRHGWNCEEHIENDIAYWDDLEGFHKAEEVLAWMPLPEPYNEDKHED